MRGVLATWLASEDESDYASVFDKISLENEHLINLLVRCPPNPEEARQLTVTLLTMFRIKSIFANHSEIRRMCA